MTNANPPSCQWGVTSGGSEDDGEGERSAGTECVCGLTIVLHQCVCGFVRLISQCLHHQVRDPISVLLTKMPIKLTTMKTK